MSKIMSHQKNFSGSKGFTLVELLITVVISSFIIAGVYAAYSLNQRQYTNQRQVIEMQQNIRAAMYNIMQELRMVGYDPTGTAGAGFVAATATRLQFTKDITDDAGTAPDGDGDTSDTNENIIFGFNPVDDAAPADGVADAGAASLMVSYDNGATYNPVADNISAIEFLYTLDDGTQTSIPTALQLNDIRSVTISILARSANGDSNFTNTSTYTRGSGATWAGGGGGFRRRLLVSNVQCRNIGL